MLSTSNKALILALPISWNPTFAGYEPACSIRLIVPRNMRILAKLSSRRLTFAQQQIEPQQQQQANIEVGEFFNQKQLWMNVSQNQFVESEQKTIETEGNVLAFRFLLERFAQKQTPDLRFQVVLTAFQTLGENSDLNTNPVAAPGWLPPSSENQNAQFICDQQRLISTNLACDGYKNCQASPEQMLELQVNQLNQQQQHTLSVHSRRLTNQSSRRPQPPQPPDGHDEELATCLALRQPATTTQLPNTIQTLTNDLGKNQLNESVWPPTSGSSSGGHSQQSSLLDSIWSRFLQSIGRDSLVGFQIGFLLVLVLLTCCSGCLYFVYLMWRKCSKRNRHSAAGATTRTGRRDRSVLSAARRQNQADAYDDDELKSSLDSARASTSLQKPQQTRRQESLEREQNLENVARLKASLLSRQRRDGDHSGQQLPSSDRQTPTQLPPSRSPTKPPLPPSRRTRLQQQQQRQLQSILKKPAGPAPLARFETQRPSEAPPRVPSRTGFPQKPPSQEQRPTPPTRGALSSSLTSAHELASRRARLGATGQTASGPQFQPTPATRRQQQQQIISSSSPKPAGMQFDWQPQHSSKQISQGQPTPSQQQQQREFQFVPPPRPPSISSPATGAPPSGSPANQQQQQQQPQAESSFDGKTNSQLNYESRTTKTEKTSSRTGSQQVTIYQYSSDVAQYSESYLLRTTGGQSRPTVRSPAGGHDDVDQHESASGREGHAEQEEDEGEPKPAGGYRSMGPI